MKHHRFDLTVFENDIIKSNWSTDSDKHLLFSSLTWGQNSPKSDDAESDHRLEEAAIKTGGLRIETSIERS